MMFVLTVRSEVDYYVGIDYSLLSDPVFTSRGMDMHFRVSSPSGSVPLYSALFYTVVFRSILIYSVWFYSALFYPVLFSSILFFSILLYCILFYFVLFSSILLCSILLYSTLFYPVLFSSILLCSILLYCALIFSIVFDFFVLGSADDVMAVVPGDVLRAGQSEREPGEHGGGADDPGERPHGVPGAVRVLLRQRHVLLLQSRDLPDAHRP